MSKHRKDPPPREGAVRVEHPTSKEDPMTEDGMRIERERARLRLRDGFALEATLLILVLFGVLIMAAAGGIGWTMRTTSTDIQGTRVNYASEGGAESVMASLESGMADGYLDDSELGSLTAPSFPGFTYETFAAVRDGSPYSQPVTEGPFAGLFSLNQKINITVQARDAANNRSRSIVTVNAQAIPVFQMGVFYQNDLEIHPGATMNFEGWIHTNANLYLSSTSNSIYWSQLTTPDSVFWQRKDVNNRGNNVFIKNNAAVNTQLNFDSRGTTQAQFVANSEARFNTKLKSMAHAVTELRLPLPTGMDAMELVMPRSGADAAQVQEVKYAWRADWHINVPVNAAGFAVAASALCTTSGPNIYMIRSGAGGAGTAVPAAGVAAGQCGDIFTLQANAFMEGRENVQVDLLNIDVAKLRAWVNTSAPGRRSYIMYITFTKTDGTPITRFPAVRLRNATNLPNPMAFATDRPVYVWGNFNNGAPWYPASLAGDALTFLSNCWTDAAHVAYAVTTACAAGATMSVYAAVAMGHSPTPCDWQRSGCGGGNYGGGLENFPRFLENWTGRTLLYRGSLVSLYFSQYADLQRWNWRGYYNAPTRDWRFDTRFNSPANMPPGTPMVGSVFQVAYRPVY